MKRMRVTYSLTDAWETWTVEVPDDVTADDVLAGRVDAELSNLEESGSGRFTPTDVNELEGS